MRAQVLLQKFND